MCAVYIKIGDTYLAVSGERERRISAKAPAVKSFTLDDATPPSMGGALSLNCLTTKMCSYFFLPFL